MDSRLCCCCFKAKDDYLSCLQDLSENESIASIIKFHLHVDVSVNMSSFRQFIEKFVQFFSR